MFENVSESKKGLIGYVISLVWCSSHTKEKPEPFFKQKFQHLFKSCARMSQKGKMDFKVTQDSPLDVV